MTDTTSARVRKIICEHLCVHTGDITDDTILSDMGADSLDRIELSLAFEDEFHVKITDEEWDSTITFDSTIGTLSAFLDKLTAR